MFVPPASAWLSWNTARLLALIFNAFSGLVSYLDGVEKGELGLDSVVQLHILQGQLIDLETAFSPLDTYHPQIREAVKKIRANLGTVASQAHASRGVGIPDDLNTRHWRAGFAEHRILNESYRWALKEIVARGSHSEQLHAIDGWFGTQSNSNNDSFLSATQRCLLHLVREECDELGGSLAATLSPKGSIGYGTTRPLLLLYLTTLSGRCDERLTAYFTDRKLNVSEYAAERCANVFDETLPFRREKRVLARLTPQRLHLMMEQLLVCGGYGGFVEFANPHLLITILSWQHPQLGCIAAERPEPVSPHLHHLQHPQHVEGGGVGGEQQSRADACLIDVSLTMGLCLAVFLRFLLDPGPWPEHHYPDQLVHFDYTVVAEEKFARYDYIKWVHDANVPVQMSMGLEADLVGARLLPPRPPPSSWSPDLIAFVLLLFVFVAGSVVAHHLFSNSNSRIRRVKQLYPYAFKKL